MAASTRRARRGERAAPEPATPPKWLKRQGTDFPGLDPYHVVSLLEEVEGTKQQKLRRTRAESYLEILNSENPDARSCDDLSKQQIDQKLKDCVEAFWETYDEAMKKFRAQNVEAPAPAPAVAPEPEDYDELGYDALVNLVSKRKSKKWAAKQKKKYEKDNTSPGMRELLRDQAADSTQWDLVTKHRAPAPKYAEGTVSKSLTKGCLDADTVEKWLYDLKDETAIEAFNSRKEARIVISRTLPTAKNAARGPEKFRSSIAERLGRPAEPADIVAALVDAANVLGDAWDAYEMVPDCYEGVTVDDLRHRLEALEAPEVSAAQLKGEPKPVSAERRTELKCMSMFCECGIECQNWSRKLALALGEGVADYAEKAAQLKRDHQNYFDSIRNVTAAVAARLRADRRRDWNSSNRGTEHDNVPKVRDARVGAWKRFATPRGGAFNYKPSVKPQE